MRETAFSNQKEFLSAKKWPACQKKYIWEDKGAMTHAPLNLSLIVLGEDGVYYSK